MGVRGEVEYCGKTYYKVIIVFALSSNKKSTFYRNCYDRRGREREERGAQYYTKSRYGWVFEIMVIEENVFIKIYQNKMVHFREGTRPNIKRKLGLFIKLQTFL